METDSSGDALRPAFRSVRNATDERSRETGDSCDPDESGDGVPDGGFFGGSDLFMGFSCPQRRQNRMLPAPVPAPFAW